MWDTETADRNTLEALRVFSYQALAASKITKGVPSRPFQVSAKQRAAALLQTGRLKTLSLLQSGKNRTR